MQKNYLYALFMAVLVACSGKSEEDSGDSGVTETTSPDRTACDARSDAGLEMQPGSTPSTTAPAIMELDSPYTVMLQPNGGGWVRLALPEAGTYVLQTGFAGVVFGMWTDEAEVELEEPRANRFCVAAIPEVYTIEVSGPQSYYLQLGPLTSREFWLYLQKQETADSTAE